MSLGLIWILLTVLLTVQSKSLTKTNATTEESDSCSNIHLPEIQEFERIRNSEDDVIGYRVVLTIGDVKVHPTWHRFHEIPELRSHEFNYPLPENDPDFQIKTHSPLTNIMETSVEMIAEYDSNTRYGLQLDLDSDCGPLILYLKLDIPDIDKVKTFPIVLHKASSVAELPKVCEDQSLTLTQTTEIQNEQLKIEGTAGLTRIIGKRVGINAMEEIYEAYEFNPESNAEYKLDQKDSESASTAQQSWTIKDVRKANYVGLYQFYITLDTLDPKYKKDPTIYMLSVPFAVKPEHYEATSIGIHPCYPFRNSIRNPGEEPPVKHLGTVKGYRPCFRVLVQTSEPVRLQLSPYVESEENPQPSFAGPSVGGMTEYWYVLDEDRIPQRSTEYMLSVSTDDYTFGVPFYLTQYTPAVPILTVEGGVENQTTLETLTLTCTVTGYPVPEVEFYDMNKYYTLGGDTHWDLDKIRHRFYPLGSLTTAQYYDNETEISTVTKTLTVTTGQQQTMMQRTLNRKMPQGVSCVTWNDFSHNIAFWSPVKEPEEEMTTEKPTKEPKEEPTEKTMTTEKPTKEPKEEPTEKTENATNEEPKEKEKDAETPDVKEEIKELEEEEIKELEEEEIKELEEEAEANEPPNENAVENKIGEILAEEDADE